LRHANRAAGVRPAFRAIELEDQLGAAVDHARLAVEALGRVHHAEDAHPRTHAVEIADRALEAAEHRERREPRGCIAPRCQVGDGCLAALTGRRLRRSLELPSANAPGGLGGATDRPPTPRRAFSTDRSCHWPVSEAADAVFAPLIQRSAIPDRRSVLCTTLSGASKGCLAYVSSSSVSRPPVS